MSLYSQFVKQNIHSVPGATQTERMRNVAKLWQQHKASASGKAPRRKRAKSGKGAVDDTLPPLQDPADPNAAVAAQDGSGCCSGAGRKRKSRKRGGEIASIAPPIQWSGGALNPLAAGNLGPRPSQVGLGVFGDLMESVGLGFRPTEANNAAMHRSEPTPQKGGAMLGNFVNDIENLPWP